VIRPESIQVALRAHPVARHPRHERFRHAFIADDMVENDLHGGIFERHLVVDGHELQRFRMRASSSGSRVDFRAATSRNGSSVPCCARGYSESPPQKWVETIPRKKSDSAICK
jgi:hypothetical protein